MVRQRFSQEQHQLELEWARRFTALLKAQGGPELNVETARPPEPADVLLMGPDGRQIHLQLAEAIDKHRIMRARIRHSLLARLWDTALIDSLSGLAIYFLDLSQVSSLPSLTPHAVKKAVEELRRGLASCRRLARIYPESPWEQGHGWKSVEVEVAPGLKIAINYARYATADLGRPLKHFWMSGGVIEEKRLPNFFEPVVLQKAAKYSPISQEFWLLVYSTDCLLSQAETSGIRASLQDGRSNPFDRIYAMPLASQVAQLHPFADNTALLRAENPQLIIFPRDSVQPLFDDDRWTLPPAVTPTPSLGESLPPAEGAQFWRIDVG